MATRSSVSAIFVSIVVLCALALRVAVASFGARAVERAFCAETFLAKGTLRASLFRSSSECWVAKSPAEALAASSYACAGAARGVSSREQQQFGSSGCKNRGIL